MPSVNMQVLEESRRHQVVQEYEVYPLNTSNVDDYQVKLTELASSIEEDVRIIKNNNLLDQWSESKSNVWSKLDNLKAKTPQIILGLSGNPSSEDIDDGDNTFDFWYDFEKTSQVLTTLDEVHGAGAPYYLDHSESVKVVGDYAYVCSALGDSFGIYDISDPTNIILKDVITGVGSPNYLNGCHHCDIVGNYAYVTAYLDNSLVIFNISDKTNITLVGEIHGAGSPNYLQEAAGIVVDGNYAYICAGIDDSVTIINVSTPASPSYVARLSGAGSPNYLNGPYMLIKEGNYLYVSTYVDNSLVIIDVSTPSSPSLVGEIHGAGSPNYLDGGWGLAKSGNYVYVAANHDNSLTVIDVSTPASPSYYARSITHTSAIDDVVISGNYLYAACIGENGISIFDISTPGTPVYSDGIYGIGSPNYLSASHGVYVVGDYIYQCGRDDDSFTIIAYQPSSDISDWTVESGVVFAGDSSIKKRGSYSGKMGNGATNFNVAYLPIGPYTSDFILECDARIDGSNNARYWTLEKVASDYTNSVYLMYDGINDDRLESYNGVGYDTIGAMSLNTWTKFTYKVHPTTDTFDFLIDDAQETTTNGARGDISTISAFVMMEADTGYNHWVDDIRIRKYTANEPIIITISKLNRASLIKALGSRL